MNKIRVIDLLNKIANGEEVPKRIKHYQTYYTWYDNGFSKGYCKEPVMADGNSFLEINSNYDLLKEVEIIEDEDINIQDIEEIKKDGTFVYNKISHQSIIDIQNKINDLIKVVKKLDKEINDEYKRCN